MKRKAPLHSQQEMNQFTLQVQSSFIVGKYINIKRKEALERLKQKTVRKNFPKTTVLFSTCEHKQTAFQWSENISFFKRHPNLFSSMSWTACTDVTGHFSDFFWQWNSSSDCTEYRTLQVIESSVQLRKQQLYSQEKVSQYLHLVSQNIILLFY